MGVADGSSGGVRDGPCPFSASSSGFSQVSEACSGVSSAPSEGLVLQLTSSKEVDVLRIKAREFEDSPPHSSAFEMLLEVVTRTVAKSVTERSQFG